MTITKLCSELAKREKTKSQARIQAIRSIVGHLSDIFFEDSLADTAGDTVNQIWANGKNRARASKRQKIK